MNEAATLRLARSSEPTLSRVTGTAILVLVVALLVEALFESWLLVLLGQHITDPAGVVVLEPPGWPKTLRNLAYVALALLTFVLIVDRHQIGRFLTAADVALGLVIASMIVSGVVGGSSPSLIAEGMFVYLRGAILFYAIRAVAPTWPQARAVIWLVGGILAINAAVAIVFALFGPPAYAAIGVVDLSWVSAFRAQAFQEHPNHLGHILGFAVLGLMALFATARRVEWPTWLLFVALCLALALTQSRESMIAVAIATAVVVVMARGHLRTVALGFAVLAALTVVSWTLQPGSLEALRHRVVGVLGAVEVPSGAEEGVTCNPVVEDCTIAGLPVRELRVLYLQQGIELWRASPLLGYGVGQFGGSVASRNDPLWNLDPRFGPGGFDLHGFPANQVDGFWNHLLVELGAVGTLAYVAWYALLGGPGVRVARSVRRVARTTRGVIDGVQLHAVHPWAVSGLVFGAVVAGFSPALEDPLFPPLLMAVVGLSWVLAESSASTAPSSATTRPGTLPVADDERPLRILAVTNMWPVDGGFRGIFVEQLVDATRRLGHHVDVEIVAQSRSKLDYLLGARRVRSRARSGDYDIVHVHFGMTAMAARLVDSIPQVITLYGSDINARWKRWITRAGWGRVAARIYVSERLAATAHDAHPVVIANGVDMARFTPGDRDAARQAVGAGPDDRVILFGAVSGSTGKGWDVYSDVIRRLAGRGIPVRQLVLTEPGQSPRRVVEKFDAADVLLFTSRQGTEGSPTVVKEAVAMGLPVVSVDVGDVADVLAGVTPSAVIEFPHAGGDERSELVGRLEEATASILALRTRADGRERVAWLDLDAVAGRVVAVYRSVIGP